MFSVSQDAEGAAEKERGILFFPAPGPSHFRSQDEDDAGVIYPENKRQEKGERSVNVGEIGKVQEIVVEGMLGQFPKDAGRQSPVQRRVCGHSSIRNKSIKEEKKTPGEKKGQEKADEFSPHSQIDKFCPENLRADGFQKRGGRGNEDRRQQK